MTERVVIEAIKQVVEAGRLNPAPRRLSWRCVAILAGAVFSGMLLAACITPIKERYNSMEVAMPVDT